MFICSALYEEAEPFIKIYNLKKDIKITKFQIFKGNNISLIITKCGKINSAVAVTYLLTLMKAKKGDFLINIGCARAVDFKCKIGTCFLCNKIKDHDTSFTYYPDIIFKHPFKESSIETFSHIIDSKNDYTSYSLIDMESSAVYTAASVFLESHEIYFIKVVSDNSTTSKPNGTILKTLMQKNSVKISEWTSFILDNYKYDTNILSPKDITLYDKLCENLKFSISMKNELRSLIKYKKLKDYDINNFLLKYKDIDCNSKKEGKKYLEEIKSKLI